MYLSGFLISFILGYLIGSKKINVSINKEKDEVDKKDI